MARTRRTEIIHTGSDSSTDSERIVPYIRRSTRIAAASNQNSTSKALNKSTNKNKEEKEEEEDTAGFNCNICFDAAKEAVVTICGHLYCWPCLFQWLQMQSGTKECPVCKGRIDKWTLIPIYCRGSSSAVCNEERGVGSAVPPRPQGHRVEIFRQLIHALRRRETLLQGLREISFSDAEVQVERGAGIDVNNSHALRRHENFLQGLREILFSDAEVQVERVAGIDVNNGVIPHALARSNVMVDNIPLGTNNVEASLSFGISRSRVGDRSLLDISAVDVSRPRRRRRRE